METKRGKPVLIDSLFMTGGRRESRRMKKAIFAIIMLCAGITNVFGYTHEIHSGYTAGITLEEYESLWMTGGGAGLINLDDHSEAIIEGTLPLEEFVGGIWELNTGGYSSLDFSGGNLRELVTHSYATATLSGGRIEYISSSQGVGYPYIDLYCRSWDYNSTAKVLTGIWNTDNNNDEIWDTFSIQLVDVQDYVPTFDNINIIEIPEPGSLGLLAAGGIFLLRRKNAGGRTER